MLDVGCWMLENAGAVIYPQIFSRTFFIYFSVDRIFPLCRVMLTSNKLARLTSNIQHLTSAVYPRRLFSGRNSFYRKWLQPFDLSANHAGRLRLGGKSLNMAAGYAGVRSVLIDLDHRVIEIFWKDRKAGLYIVIAE